MSAPPTVDEVRELRQTYERHAKLATRGIADHGRAGAATADECLGFLRIVGTPGQLEQRMQQVCAILRLVDGALLPDEDAARVHEALGLLGRRMEDLYDHAAGWVVPTLQSFGWRYDEATGKLIEERPGSAAGGPTRRGRPGLYSSGKVAELCRAWGLKPGGTGNTQLLRSRVRAALAHQLPPDLLTDDAVKHAINDYLNPGRNVKRRKKRT
jgi:hypothetical protein